MQLLKKELLLLVTVIVACSKQIMGLMQYTLPSEHKEAGLLIETKEGPRVRKLPGQVNG